MISTITKTIAGRTYTLRLGARAMQAIEQRFNAGFPALMARMETDFRVGLVIAVIEESLNDGAGGSSGEAAAMFDALGSTAAIDLMKQVIEAAFPDAGETEGKNVERAGE